ncbi:MAG: methionine aminotransferase [Bacteroidia bacterium]|nr:methionine aminotransferase [Bacteroidia bacterium]NND51532.1 methionine aminotransferase [Flavobacteriaceae bacterium]
MQLPPSKLPDLKTTIFSVMSALAYEHGAINLSQGFPNFKGDQTLFDLVSKAMNAGYNQYAPMPGSMALRKAIARKFELLYDSSYKPESEITVTAGATQAIFTAITALIRKGDEVIVFRPAYDCYVPTIELNGGKAISIQLHHPDYKVDWNEVRMKINSNTRMIIINSPHNPSGTIFSKEDMMSLQKLTENTNIIVLSDEVYEHIIFDNETHHSVCSFPDLKSRSLITASFGKTFHNTGWKTGYCCAPKSLMEEFRKVHQFNVFSVNHPVQVALAEYLATPDHYNDLARFYQDKRDLFLSLIKGSRFEFKPSKGTYFQTVDYSNISSEDDLSFARRLTMEKGVAAIPNSAFNHDHFDQHTIRFCFAKTDDTLKRAANILQQI